MRNHIVRPHVEPPELKSGLGGYSDIITELSCSAGYDTDVTEIEMSIQDGVYGFIVNDLLRAFISTVRMKKDDLCHFTFEGSALYIPFCRAKKIVTFHHYVYRNENNSRKWYTLWKLSAMMAVKRADCIIAISDQTRTEIIRELNADPAKIRVISHMCNDSLSVDGSVPKEKWIGCMGTLTERKNYPALLRVFADMTSDSVMNGYELHICGKGPLRQSIEGLAAELGISDRVTFHQNLDNDEINAFYNQCTLILNTSSHEGLGMLTLESQVCGTPVLYFRDADIPENTTRAAVPCADERDMAVNALALLKDRELYDRKVREGLEYTKEYCSLYKERTLDVYRQVAEGRQNSD